MDDDNAVSGADEVERRIRTRMRPFPSISDSVQIGSRPSSDMTSPSTSNLVMVAAVDPGNWFLISRVAALYSKRNSSSVYLHEYMQIRLISNNVLLYLC